MVADSPQHIVEGLTGRRRHRRQRRLFRARRCSSCRSRKPSLSISALPTPRTPKSAAVNRYCRWRDAAPRDIGLGIGDAA